MLHIILLILKIIGIIIAILLGVVLLGLTAVLFVPVRYRVEVSRKEEMMPVLVRAKATWLLHLLNVRVRYPAEPKPIVRVRIALIPVFQYPGRKKKEDTATKDTPGKKEDKAIKDAPGKKKKEDIETKEIPEEEKKNTRTQNTEGEKKEKANTVVRKESGKPEAGQSEAENRKTEKAEIRETFLEEQTTENNIEIEQAEKTEEPGKQTPTETVENATAPRKKSRVKQIWEALKGLFRKLKKALENIQYTITKVCDKIRKISDNIQYYKEVIASDTFQQSYATCKEQLGYLLRKIKPDTFRAALVIGTDDPATTAQILAVHGMLYPLLGNCIALQGDFEQQRIEGQVFLKGKIRVFTFLRVFIKIYFNKEIKKLIRLLKKEAA